MAVYKKVTCCFNRHPGPFGRQVLNKHLAPLVELFKHKSLLHTCAQPFFLGFNTCLVLFARHCTANVLGVNVDAAKGNEVHLRNYLYRQMYKLTGIKFAARTFNVLPDPLVSYSSRRKTQSWRAEAGILHVC